MRFAKLPPLIFVLLLAFSVASAQPRDRERYSSDGDKDLKKVSVKGKVEQISGQKAVLKTDDGRQVTVHLGPQRYWRDKGYRLNTGAEVTVDGWGEIMGDDGGYLYAGGIYGNGYSIELMGSDGYPRWADRHGWDDDWYPCIEVYELYFGPSWGHGPWGYWGPPPRWWHRPHWWGPRWHHPPRHHCPPPPPPRYHRHGGRH